MHNIRLIVGLVFVATILWDVFETVILPRRVTRRLRLTNVFYSAIWMPWSGVARRIAHGRAREKMLALFGPLSLLLLLAVWACGLILGYALIYWGSNSHVYHQTGEPLDFWTYLYFSGVTFFYEFSLNKNRHLSSR